MPKRGSHPQTRKSKTSKFPYKFCLENVENPRGKLLNSVLSDRSMIHIRLYRSPQSPRNLTTLPTSSTDPSPVLIGVWQAVALDSLKLHPGPTLLRPVGGPPTSRGGPPTGQAACSRLLPPWTPYAVRLCPSPSSFHSPHHHTLPLWLTRVASCYLPEAREINDMIRNK
jgi:hypothetical protein